jgi:hypothetical protein
MAVCSRCGTALVATARFCAACGSPVTSSLGTTPRPATAPMSATPNPLAPPSVSPSPTPSPVVPQAAPQAAPAAAPPAAPSAPDPYARTVMGDPTAVAAAVAAATAAAAAVNPGGANAGGARAATSEPRMPTAPMSQVIAPARPNPVSPMASSVMRTAGDPVITPAVTPWNVPANMPASVPNPYAPTRPPPPVAPAAQPFAPQAPPMGMMGSVGPGAMVLVHWADGNRYPGTVLQAASGQLLVAFPNGQQQWIDARYVSPGT